MTALAASGLRARMESLDLLANNIANASTGGFKADREFYSLYVAPDVDAQDATATMPVIERPWVDFSQGIMQSTGNTLDLAINGSGFFSVKGPKGTLFTRNGSFHVAADGRLVTADGYEVLGTNGSTITLDNARPTEISADGTVQQDGAAVGQLEIVEFEASGLSKQGSNYFRSGKTPKASTATVEQGKLEASNTGTAESAVRLVSVMRQFETLQKAVAIGTEMNREAVQQVAKVGS